MREELKPCPICGCPMEIATGGDYFAHAIHTDCVLGEFGFAIDKIASWNTRTPPRVKALELDEYGGAKDGGAKYAIYEVGPNGMWTCVCYPHEDVQYRIAEGVSRDDAVRLADEDQTRRVLACLEGYDD